MSTLKTTNLQNPSAGSPALVLNTDGTCSQLGFRNAIINGNPIINQRGYVSGTSTTGANQYTLDRWRVVTSGESITWTDSNNIRTVTAPSGGVEQVIEGINILSGTYTLNWTGTATATVDGNAVSKGGNVTLTGGTNCTVRFSSGTFSLAQLEPGTVATPFERRSYGQELALCQRYFYMHCKGNAQSIGVGTAYNASLMSIYISMPVTMRINPSAYYSSGTNFYISYINGSSDTFNSPGNLVAGSPSNVTFDATNGVSVSAGSAGRVATNSSDAYIGLSAEL